MRREVAGSLTCVQAQGIAAQRREREMQAGEIVGDKLDLAAVAAGNFRVQLAVQACSLQGVIDDCVELVAAVNHAILKDASRNIRRGAVPEDHKAGVGGIGIMSPGMQVEMIKSEVLRPS